MSFASCTHLWKGPAPTFRWGVLECIAWIASREISYVKASFIRRCPGGTYSGPHPETARQAFKDLTIHLHVEFESNTMAMAIGEFLSAVNHGMAFHDSDNQIVVADGVRSFTFSGEDVGLSAANAPEEWWSVQFDAQEIIRRWPAPDTSTGDPGRPEKGFTLYIAEFRRRIGLGLTKSKKSEEAQALHSWFITNHPDQQAPSLGTIGNRIAEEFRRMKF